MRALFIGFALIALPMGAAAAQDSCPDPWASLPGTYKCDGGCDYTASVCALPDYAEGIKRWRFTIGKGQSSTGVLMVTGAKSISFAPTPQWPLVRASTTDCGSTIQFEGGSAKTDTKWKKVDSSAPACGNTAPKKKR